MKGNGKISWKFFAFILVMLWMIDCPAESELPEPANAGKTSSSLSPEKSDWKLPELLTNWKLPESVQVHGFASQSYILTSGNNFFGHSTNMGSLDFTEMGINGSWRPLPQLQTSMQVVYRRAGKTDDSLVRIDFGFLDYSFLSDDEKLAGIRLGRVVTPYGFYNDTRDMPFTRPSIILPQSIYFDINRNFALSGDGAQIYGEYRTPFGDFLLQANGFYSRTNDPDLKLLVAGNFPGSLESRPSWAARLMYEWDGGKIRLGVSSATLAAKYQPGGGRINLEPGELDFSPILFSAQYNAEKWSLTSEYAIRPVSLMGFGPMQPNSYTTGESYYVQGSYRFTNNVEGFLRYDVLYADRTDKYGKRYAAQTGMSAANMFAKDFTTGLRWDITNWFMVRAEYHRINGNNWVSNLENTGDTEQHWDLFSLSANFRF